MSNQEFFERLAKEVIRLLTEPTDLGVAYRVDLRLRPEGARGPLCLSFDSTLSLLRRAGPHLGAAGVRQGPADRRRPATWARSSSRGSSRGSIAAISAWPTSPASRRSSGGSSSAPKREGGDVRNVKTGHGGIRDIEFVIQFLQLLNGGDLPESAPATRSTRSPGWNRPAA